MRHVLHKRVGTLGSAKILSGLTVVGPCSFILISRSERAMARLLLVSSRSALLLGSRLLGKLSRRLSTFLGSLLRG